MRLLLIIILLFLPQFVWAHAEEPLSEDAFGFEGDAWLLKANFGAVSSEFEGFVCEEAFLGGDRFILVPLAETKWVTFGQTSIHVTDDACSFNHIKELAETPADADGHSGSGRVVYLANDEAGAGIWASDNAGLDFTRLDFDTTTFQLTGVRFSGPDTAVVSAYNKSTDTEIRGAARLIEIDLDSASITDLTIPEGLRYPYILGASPDGILYLAREVGQTIFWESSHGLNKLESILSWPTDALISEDGNTVWISGLMTGKSIKKGVVDAEGAVWTETIPETNAACLNQSPNGDLLICTIRRFEEQDLMSVDEDGKLAPQYLFTDIPGPRMDCPAGSEVDEICPVVWEELQRYLGLLPEEDMGLVGEPDMGADMAEPLPPGSDEDAGCCSTMSRSATSSPWALLLGLLFWRRRLTKSGV